MLPLPEPTDPQSLRATRLIWPPSIWPAHDRCAWVSARLGTGPAGYGNPAVSWSERTVKKNEDGYGRYLSWLYSKGLPTDDGTIQDRVTPARLAAFTACLKATLSSASVGTAVGALASAVRALSPDTDWRWLSRRSTRLKLMAKPSRDKRHAMRHTLELYRFGKRLMDAAEQGRRLNVAPAQRYQSGLIIALLAARPLRIRNFQAIAIGTSLRWRASATG